MSSGMTASTPARTTPVPAAQPGYVTPKPAPAPAPRMSMPMPMAAPMSSGSDSQAADADRALAAAANYQRIRQQQQAFEAQQLVEQARQEQAANQKNEALNDFTHAAQLDPSNQQAVAGRNEMADELGVGNAPTGLGIIATEVPERIQAINYSFNSAVADANNAISAGDFAAAQRAIDRARIARNTDPTIFTPQQINVFDQTIANTQASLERSKLSKASADADQAAKDAEANQAHAAAQAQAERERTVAGLIQDARVYIDQGKYREALAVIDHIQALDPSNQYASGVRLLIEDRAAIQEQRGYIEEFNRQFTQQLNQTHEAQIPYSDILRYPSDWPQISEMRDAEVKEDKGENDEDAAIQAQLDRRLPELHFNANSFSDVIDFLRDVTGANIYVDWPALERASISRDAPVTARLRDIKFSKALELVFKSVEGEDDDHKLGYTVDEGVITISTRKELNKNVATRRYDINDLLFVAPDYTNAPSLDLSNNNSQSAGGGGGGGGGGSQNAFQNANTQNVGTDEANQRQERIEEIKKYIIDNVAPATWKDNGGDVGNISSSPLRAVLLITQTPENHHQIDKVLDSLRASQALQVSIETRFLTVQRNYLEDIGVNTDFEFNPNSYWSTKFSPITLTNGQSTLSSTALGGETTSSAAGTTTLGPTQAGSVSGLDWTSRVSNAGVPGSIAANTSDYPTQTVLAGSYIDNMTVSFLIRAVEANQNTTSLTAPRLTLFSGQRAVIVVETQEAYVSGLQAVTGTGAALFQPTVSTVPAVAVVTSVLATVSPDRKYVYLDIRPQLARLIALNSLTESALVTNAGLNGVASSQVISGTLQLPTLSETLVETSCSVPDGATLLLGGQTLAGETDREQGVPVLSKIPFLKRLFTNRAESQDEQVLLILVKPTILIQHEQEQKQFPLLSSKVSQ
jgi:general secretion pathway protein D